MGVVERSVSLVNSMSGVQFPRWVAGTPLVCFLAFSLAACGGGASFRRPGFVPVPVPKVLDDWSASSMG